MRAEARGHRAGIHAELLQRIREWEGHVDVRHGVGVVAAIQKIGGAVALAAGHRNPGGTPEGLTARIAAVAVGSRAQRDDQLRRLPSVERQTR